MQALTVDRLNKAQKYLESGKPARAESICRKLLKDKTGYIDIRLTLSKALLAQNKGESALKFLSEAANQQQDNPILQTAAGDLALQIKKYGEAISYYQISVSHEPDNPAYWYRLSDALFQGASASFKTQQKLSDASEDVEIKAKVDFYDDAIAISTKAIELFPEEVSLLRLTGEILKTAGIEEAAYLCFEKCLPLEPFDSVAHYHWLEQKRQKNCNQEIVEYALTQGKRIENDAICNRVITYAYGQLGHYDKSLKHIDLAVQAAPENDKFMTTKGHCLYRLGRYEESIQASNAALKINPDAAYPKWLNCLSNWKLGNLPEAHKGNAYRFEVEGVCTKFNLKSPQWKGESLEHKKLYVWSDQGIGDVFKTASMLAEIPHHENLILAVQKKCIALMTELYPNVEIRQLPEKLPALRIVSDAYGSSETRSNEFPPIEEDFDYQIPMGTLIEVLRPDIEAFNGKDRKLHIPEIHTAPFRELDIMQSPHTTKVGLSWSSMSFGDPEAYGYLNLEELLPIMRMPGFEFYNFQYTVKENEIKAFREKHNVPLYHAPGLDLLDDMLGTAAFNSCMDLFVGPGSTSSDIAGATGVKCFRYACCHYQDNLGQPFVPWFNDQKFLDIPFGSRASDYLEEIKQWLLANKKP